MIPLAEVALAAIMIPTSIVTASEMKLFILMDERRQTSLDNAVNNKIKNKNQCDDAI